MGGCGSKPNEQEWTKPQHGVRVRHTDPDANRPAFLYLYSARQGDRGGWVEKWTLMPGAEQPVVVGKDQCFAHTNGALYVALVLQREYAPYSMPRSVVVQPCVNYNDLSLRVVETTTLFGAPLPPSSEVQESPLRRPTPTITF